jgi:hypothetical protein
MKRNQMIWKPLAFTLLMAVSGTAYAKAHISRSSDHTYDSLLPERDYTSVHAGMLLDLLDAENNFTQAGNQKTMFRLLRIAGVKSSLRNNTLGARIFLDLANISTRLKLYPLAMKCLGHATRMNEKKLSVSGLKTTYASDTASFSQLIQIDTLAIVHHTTTPLLESPLVQAENIRCSFEDGKTGISWAIIIHIKQPIHGSRKAFTKINNVGHTFITLIKMNSDNSAVTRSFGFYPAKKYFLSATPVGPGDDPVFKDDARHPWDETIGKFITEKKFNRILANLEKFNRSRYNLNKNNCTDFALTEAMLAGFDIKQTAGRWPLGKGNNPANAGQSLLEGNFENTDKEYPETLVVNEGQGLFELN